MPATATNENMDIDSDTNAGEASTSNANGNVSTLSSSSNANKSASESGKCNVMASSTVVPSITISLHPLVIMNISEHWTRIRAQNGKPQQGKSHIIDTTIDWCIFEMR